MVAPYISEFSYGFALTNELVGWGPLSSAPIFPSLIEEGKRGGGYDVHLDRPGFPLYLQFKRAECMFRRSAKQVASIKKFGQTISIPFYRFSLMERWRSAQHEMLVELDRGQNAVFYAAPRFHTTDEINNAWANGCVAQYSVFVRPRAVGTLTDDALHYVAYDDQAAFFCTNAKSIKFVSAEGLLSQMQKRLDKDDRPLRKVIPEALADAERAISAAEKRIAGQSTLDVDLNNNGERPLRPAPTPRRPAEIGDEKTKLRQLADLASRDLNTQLIIVQPNK